jgi:hypothetical protein
MTPQKLSINHLNPSSLLRRGWVLTLLAVGSFALSQVQAAVDTPDPGAKPVSNTADGQNALLSITSGIHNSAFGFDGLVSNSTGNFNTAVGSVALLLNNGDPTANEAIENTAVGAGALLSNTIGRRNTAVGTFAMFNNVDGRNNNVVGREALVTNVDGVENNAMGDLAMFNNATGDFNTAIGDDALFSCTDCSSNVAIGDEAGANLTTGSQNIYIGAGVPAGVPGEVRFIRIGDPTITDYDTFINGIFGRGIDAGTAVAVGVDANQKLGTVLVNANGSSVPFKPQAMLDESLKQQKRIAELEATVERQQRGMEVLTAQLKEQAAQIQKVSAQLEVSKPAPRTVANK